MATRRDFLSTAVILGFGSAVSANQLPVISMMPDSPPRVLINLGHDWNKRNTMGAHFDGVGYEYVIATKIAEEAVSILQTRGIVSMLTRNETEYAASLLDYRQRHYAQIHKVAVEYSVGRKMDMNLDELITQIAIIEYAKGFDALVSIHLNDLDPKYRNGFQGFAVGYSNKNAHKKSRALATGIHAKLLESFTPSNQPAEMSPQDGKWIPGLMVKNYVVTGSDVTKVNVPSVLVECGFIFEKYGPAKDQTIASGAVQGEYAQRISEGVEDFLKARG